jgi:D-alanyl-D-alanine carboxypeptidase (penicillin-binding protein 5/6)
MRDLRRHAVFGIALSFSGAVPVHAAEFQLVAKAAVLMEIRSGKNLWAKNKNLPLPPASTAKILTALVVLEQVRLDDNVKVPPLATKSSGATIKLQSGEQITVRDLLYAMLVGSANDAAIALALHAAGSIAKFTDLMNRKARQLGARQSRFANPTGLPQRNQLTTAEDLAIITRVALQHPEFRKIVTTKGYPWKGAKWEGTLNNSNQLLETYEGAMGVKTGNTKEAGYCLVAAAKRADAEYIAVVLNSSEKAVWKDAKKLLDYGFDPRGSTP